MLDFLVLDCLRIHGHLLQHCAGSFVYISFWGRPSDELSLSQTVLMCEVAQQRSEEQQREEAEERAAEQEEGGKRRCCAFGAVKKDVKGRWDGSEEEFNPADGEEHESNPIMRTLWPSKDVKDEDESLDRLNFQHEIKVQKYQLQKQRKLRASMGILPSASAAGRALSTAGHTLVRAGSSAASGVAAVVSTAGSAAAQLNPLSGPGLRKQDAVL